MWLLIRRENVVYSWMPLNCKQINGDFPFRLTSVYFSLQSTSRKSIKENKINTICILVCACSVYIYIYTGVCVCVCVPISIFSVSIACVDRILKLICWINPIFMKSRMCPNWTQISRAVLSQWPWIYR